MTNTTIYNTIETTDEITIINGYSVSRTYNPIALNRNNTKKIIKI